jgi:signal peptidase I
VSASDVDPVASGREAQQAQEAQGLDRDRPGGADAQRRGDAEDGALTGHAAEGGHASQSAHAATTGQAAHLAHPADAEDREATEDTEQPQGALGMVTAAVREVVVVVAMALVLSFVVKTWLFQAFFIPSGSMEDTLLVGDRVIVSKLTPGPVDLEHGDVVVFQDPGGWLEEAPPVERGGVSTAVHDALVFVGLLPAESEDHLIKRVIGLPGDHVVCCSANHKLVVNDVEITEPYLKPGDVPSSMTFDITVPSGHVWVMGDHRSDSEDSRFHDPSGTGKDGSVPVDDITGRAVAVVWPLGRAGWLSDHEETFADVPHGTAGP